MIQYNGCVLKHNHLKDSFGFLFYETLDGFHFRSIEQLLKQEAVPYQQADRPVEGNKIIENNLNESNDIGMNLRQGMYANRTLYIDIENHTFQEVNFDVTQLKLKKPLKLLDGIEKHPSRLMFRVNDFGVAQVGAAKSEVQPESEETCIKINLILEITYYFHSR